MGAMFQDSSSVQPVGVLFLIGMVILTLSLSRRNAVIPLLITTCYMPLGQSFLVAGLNFQFFRIVLLAGWCRALSRGEAGHLKLTPIDRLFICWAGATLVMGTLGEPSFGRLINRFGEVYNAVGVYFLIRCWLRNLEDVMGAIRFMGWMILPLAVSMIVEKFTTRNVFSVFGGVPEHTFVRDGKLRCQGAFRHPIMAGTYAATLLPFFVALWFKSRRDWLPALVGAGSAVVATVAAASSGPLLALVSVCAGFGLWHFRFQMRLFRWGVVLLLLALAAVMNAPIWYIGARISEFSGGGSGWWRSYVIDQAVGHFGEWWLVGSTYTAHWAPAGIVLSIDQNNMDITNNYISEGLGGGILKLGLFLAIIVKCFKTIGRWTRRANGVVFAQRIFVWSIGVSLAAHCVSFVSVSYFDQIVVMWYWLLAVISMLSLQSVSIPCSQQDVVTAELTARHFKDQPV